MSKFHDGFITVEAEQFHQSGDPELYPIGVTWGGDLPDGTGCYVVITTIHGYKIPIADGDWIITELGGKHCYPCKPHIFEATFEPVQET
jgi:hypothetical protein